MDTPHREPSPAGTEADEEPAGETPSGRPAAWRRIGVAVVAGGIFFLASLVLLDSLPELIYLGCAVFLPIGMGLGWKSGRPWRDGALYGLFAGLVASLILLGIAFPFWWGGFFLALPQGVVGAWVGSRLPGRPGRRRLEGKSPASPSPPSRP